MSRGDENLFARWSRLKNSDAAEAAAPVAAPRPAPTAPLPDPATLDFNADFSVFLGAQVDEAIKRRALKSLFHSAEFNVMDGLDVYIDDYSLPDPVSEELLRNLAHARDMLFGDAVAAPAVAEQATPVGAQTEEGHEH